MLRRPRRKNSGWPTPRAGSLHTTCSAPSSTSGYPFTLTLDGAWEELPSPHPHHTPEAVAAHHALTIARNITSTHALTDITPATARVNTLLGYSTNIPNAPVRLTWAQASLTADPEAVSTIAQQQRHLHEEEQRVAKRNRCLKEARDLRDTLMSDPSLALSYWFATAPQTIDEDTLSRLEKLHSTAAAYAPQGHWAPLARMLHAFADQLPDEARLHLIDTLATLIDRYGRPDIASTIRALGTSESGRSQ
ncbi:hypothetical protein [Streptomyces sp. NPDC020965]|uniref:hypothetical protein n=1 Tax=Streptomyces sp. NPDC020965 TaxID=3365105 RepID=UPI0037BC417D